METHHPKSSVLKSVEDVLDLYLVKKAPFQLPAQVKELVVKVGPWITLVLVVLSLPLFLALFGVSFVLPGMMIAAPIFGFLFILPLLTLALEFLALPGLFGRKKTGWNYLFYAELVATISSILGGHISSILWCVIGFYFLFQVRSYYK